MQDLASPALNLGSGHPSEPVAEHIMRWPGVQRVPHPKIAMFIAKNFLEPELCQLLMIKIDAERRPSTIADANDDYAFRTSETCDFSSRDPVVTELKRRMTVLTGLDPAHGEPMQGQRYDIGQEFKAHTDYFEPQGRDFREISRSRGPADLDGDALSQRSRGRRCDAVQGNRQDHPARDRQGRRLEQSASGRHAQPVHACHHAMKVRAGLKYVVTQWYRERPWGW